jgi:hypothetical protein
VLDDVDGRFDRGNALRKRQRVSRMSRSASTHVAAAQEQCSNAGPSTMSGLIRFIVAKSPNVMPLA